MCTKMFSSFWLLLRFAHKGELKFEISSFEIRQFIHRFTVNHTCWFHIQHYFECSLLRFCVNVKNKNANSEKLWYFKGLEFFQDFDITNRFSKVISVRIHVSFVSIAWNKNFNLTLPSGQTVCNIKFILTFVEPKFNTL